MHVLNSHHKNINFTVEHGSATLDFLNVEVNVNDNGFDTWT